MIELKRDRLVFSFPDVHGVFGKFENVDLQAIGQRKSAGGAKPERMLQARFIAEHDRMEQADTDRWVQVGVLVAFAELLDQLFRRCAVGSKASI